MHSCIHAFIHHSSFIIHHSSFIIHHSSSSPSSLFNYILSLLAIIGIITKASVSSLESSCFSKYSGAPQGHHMIFHAKGPPLPPPPYIYHCYISYIIYHCCILVGTNNAATRWWQSLRNSPLPFLLSPTPLAFVIHPRPQVHLWVAFTWATDGSR